MFCVDLCPVDTRIDRQDRKSREAALPGTLKVPGACSGMIVKQKAANISSRGRRFGRTPIATAVSLALLPVAAGAAYDSGSIRLQLDDEISSRVAAPAEPSFTGRLEVAALIQSHPDPLYLALEQRYEALPPFTQATEEIPEQYIVEATLGEKLSDSVRGLTAGASTFIPQITSTVRMDNVSASGTAPQDGGGDRGYQTLLATINPTFRYQKEQRKWRLAATYDYAYGQYYHDRDARISDHEVGVNWTRRLGRGQEFTVTSLASDTHDRDTSDAIVDFDSARTGDELNFNRYLVNLNYRRGTARDRSRYDVFYFKELSELDNVARAEGDYQLSRDGVGAEYTWQVRRQLALVAEAKYSQFDYQQSFRDHDHFSLLAGTDLILARRLRADLRVGVEEKSFASDRVDDSSNNFVWRASLDWALRRSSNLRLHSGRQIFEFVDFNGEEQEDSFNVQTWAGLSWRERWSDKIRTSVDLTYRENNSNQSDYSDDAYQLISSVIYRFSDSLQFVLDGAYTRETNSFGTRLNRRTFTFTSNFSL